MKRSAQPFPSGARTKAGERTFCRLKDFRRLATRYDRLDATFIATICIAAAIAYFLK